MMNYWRLVQGSTDCQDIEHDPPVVGVSPDNFVIVIINTNWSKYNLYCRGPFIICWNGIVVIMTSRGLVR